MAIGLGGRFFCAVEAKLLFIVVLFECSAGRVLATDLRGWTAGDLEMVFTLLLGGVMTELRLNGDTF